MNTSQEHPDTPQTLTKALKNANADATITQVPHRPQYRVAGEDKQDPNNLTYLRPHQAAPFLGVAVSTLARWRVEGDGPRFCRPQGKRVITYDKADLVAWLEASKRASTSEGGK